MTRRVSAAACAVEAGVDVCALLARADLKREQIGDWQARIGFANQIALLRLVAEALDDGLSGFHLAEGFELWEIGLLYYIMASARTLREAFLYGGRYGAITNEAVASTCLRTGAVRVRLAYTGVARHADRQQAEFWMTGLVRIARQLTHRRLQPLSLSLVHPRCGASHRFEAFIGCRVTYETAEDELVLPSKIDDDALASADRYLHKLLRGYC